MNADITKPAGATVEETGLATKTDATLEKIDSVFGSSSSMSHYWRIAELFAESAFVPQHFRKKPGDCLIAIEMAMQMQEHPLMLMQQSFMVSGTPGWKTQLMIARANRMAGFNGRIKWTIENLVPTTLKSGGSEYPNLKVTAWVIDSDGERLEAYADTKMAIAEDWTRNAKYKGMPEHMLRWRSAAFLIRLHCPEVMMGMQTVEELETMPREVSSATFAEVVGEIEASSDETIETKAKPADAEISMDDLAPDTDANGRKAMPREAKPKKAAKPKPLSKAKVKAIEKRITASEKFPGDIYHAIKEVFGVQLAEVTADQEAKLEALLETEGV